MDHHRNVVLNVMKAIHLQLSEQYCSKLGFAIEYHPSFTPQDISRLAFKMTGNRRKADRMVLAYGLHCIKPKTPMTTDDLDSIIQCILERRHQIVSVDHKAWNVADDVHDIEQWRTIYTLVRRSQPFNWKSRRLATPVPEEGTALLECTSPEASRLLHFIVYCQALGELLHSDGGPYDPGATFIEIYKLAIPKVVVPALRCSTVFQQDGYRLGSRAIGMYRRMLTGVAIRTLTEVPYTDDNECMSRELMRHVRGYPELQEWVHQWPWVHQASSGEIADRRDAVWRCFKQARDRPIGWAFDVSPCHHLEVKTEGKHRYGKFNVASPEEWNLHFPDWKSWDFEPPVVVETSLKHGLLVPIVHEPGLAELILEYAATSILPPLW